MMLVLKLLKLLVFLVAVCHVTACGWWGVGTYVENDAWVLKYGYEGSDVGLQYLVTLHWSFFMFSGGLEELAPQNALERFYTILIWILCFMSGLVMLSFLTSSLTQQYIIGGSGARQMATLKKYLNQNKIPKNLIKRLCRSAKHAISGDLQPESVDFLNVVSEPLRIEMHYEMYSRVLAPHPFFDDFLREGNQVMRRVCHSCISMVLFDGGDVLFYKGDEAADPRMYFVCNGSLDYIDKYGETCPVHEKQWASEAALWVSWRYQGTLMAATDAKIAVLDADGFQDVCSQYLKLFKGAGFNPKMYAALFVEEMNKLGPSEWSDLQIVKHDAK